MFGASFVRRCVFFFGAFGSSDNILLDGQEFVSYLIEARRKVNQLMKRHWGVGCAPTITVPTAAPAIRPPGVTVVLTENICTPFQDFRICATMQEPGSGSGSAMVFTSQPTPNASTPSHHSPTRRKKPGQSGNPPFCSAPLLSTPIAKPLQCGRP